MITASFPTPTASPAAGARRREAGLAGRLNHEWDRLCAEVSSAARVASWTASCEVLENCRGLADVEQTVKSASRDDADRVLLHLLRLHQAGDALAGQTVLHLMLGKALRIASTRAGRDSRENLEHSALAALWTVIATYPVDRRPAKVAANIAMDTLHLVTVELGHQRAESPTNPDVLAVVEPAPAPNDGPADLELLNLLAWAVDHATISAADATLVMDIYCPGPGEAGGAAAAARHGLSWSAARQRASRAVRKIAEAVRADSAATAAA